VTENDRPCSPPLCFHTSRDNSKSRRGHVGGMDLEGVMSVVRSRSRNPRRILCIHLHTFSLLIKKEGLGVRTVKRPMFECRVCVARGCGRRARHAHHVRQANKST
jgi:hypothetical protein